MYVRNTFYIISLEIETEFQADCGTRLQSIYNNRNNGYKKNNKLECLEVVVNIHENADLLGKVKDVLPISQHDKGDNDYYKKALIF